MIPNKFEYLTPKTLDEAISMLQQYGEEAKILSGGHSLIPMMKLRFATPEYLIDINELPGLDYIKEEDGYLKIGALTREVALEDSELINSKYPLLLDTAKMIADPQVRNLATIAGNLAHGDAANDHPATMLALNASIVITGSTGDRVVSINDFFQGFFTTALASDEILTEIKIPIPEAGSGGAYYKLERKVGDYATAGVAVQLTVDGSGTCSYVGIGLTNVNATPMRALRSEQMLNGQVINQELIDRAAAAASEDCSPSADLRGDEEYKRAMVGVLTRRTLKKALERAQS
jgi:carbon-monoxide dehydrogenase medium subunit